MSPIVISKYHKLEITFFVKLSVFICLPHSHIVTYRNVSRQLFEMTLMPSVPVPQVVFMAGHVYTVGGFNGSLRVRTVERV